MQNTSEQFYPIITLALTGASGIQYGLRLLECLVKAQRQVYLLVSNAARIVAKMEAGITLPARSCDLVRRLTDRLGATPGQIQSFENTEWTAPVASGSGAPRAMVVCPCTMGALAAIAAGMSENLIERAADVVLKERGKLILVPREAPFSEIHLENMHRPYSVEQIVDFIVARILDHLSVPQDLLAPWGRDKVSAEPPRTVPSVINV